MLAFTSWKLFITFNWLTGQQVVIIICSDFVLQIRSDGLVRRGAKVLVQKIGVLNFASRSVNVRL